MKPFQAILLALFGILALISVFIFASFTGRSDDSVGEVVIWGVVPDADVAAVLNAVQDKTHSFSRVSYEEFPEAGFTDMLVQAIAALRGPDLILFPAERILKDADKVTQISYNTLSRRTFQDSFIEAGEAFLTPSGILGIPFYIDPFVMYWNRTLYAEAGIASPPVYWDEFTANATRLTKKTPAGTLTVSAVALGAWDNVAHAKDILVSLVRGLGNPVIARDESGVPEVVLGRGGEGGANPAELALRFYSGFADPAGSVFSWSRARPLDRDAFLAGSLATYFGAAREATGLRIANPNLNFDAAHYPTVRGGFLAVPARLYALSVPNGADNPVGAARAALLMTEEESQRALIAATGLPSVRRDILVAAPANPYDAIFRSAALNAFLFLDPDPDHSGDIFEAMVDDVTSGRLKAPDAVRRGEDALRGLLKVR